MLVLILCFMLSGLVICYCIILYIFTGVYWQQHDFIRKSVRISAAISQFFLFTIATCIVKRALYYRDEGRFSDKFWHRLIAVVCPTVSNHPIESFQTKIVEQSASEDQPDKKRYTKFNNFGQKWTYLIVIILFIGKFLAFCTIIRFESISVESSTLLYLVAQIEKEQKDFRFLISFDLRSLFFE